MRKTLMLVVALTVLLAGVVGYIIGSAPERLANPKTSDPNTNKSQKQSEFEASTNNQTTTVSGSDKTESGELPTIDSLLVTPITVPLPLSLRAGIFFDRASAQASALEITGYGYPATAQEFLSRDTTVLHLVVLAPFKNEANLQLAKYELFKQHDIVTQRIITPK